MVPVVTPIISPAPREVAVEFKGKVAFKKTVLVLLKIVVLVIGEREGVNVNVCPTATGVEFMGVEVGAEIKIKVVIGAKVGAGVGAKLGFEMAEVGAAVDSKVRAGVGTKLEAIVGENVLAEVDTEVGAKVEAVVGAK